MAQHQFRLYNNRANLPDVLLCILVPLGFSLIAWTMYQPIKQLNMCFLKSSRLTPTRDTVFSALWILSFFLRPILKSCYYMPAILFEWYKQIQILKHESQLPMNGKLVLYKDHHRRLFHVIFTMTTIILFFVWIFITIPYTLQMLCLIFQVNTYVRLDQLSPLGFFLFDGVCKSIAFVNCSIFVGAFVLYFSLRL